MYEIGQDLDSLTKSLDNLETDLSRPMLVQISTRSQSTVDTVLTPCTVATAQYSVRSETKVPSYKSSESVGQPKKISTSFARIASAEDVRIEADTVVIGTAGTRHGKSTIV